MFTQRKFFIRTVTGLILFGLVTIGLRAASHVVTKAATKTVAEYKNRNYRLVIGETAANPDDHMNSMGVHAEGYIYSCTLYRFKVPVSTYTVRREKGFRATEVNIEPLKILHNPRVMLDVEFRNNSETSVVADCMITPPALDDKYGSGIVQWRTLENTGV